MQREAPDVVLRGVTKAFGDYVAVAGIDLEIRRGEFLALLGPSGCGKTTTLRMIAGFQEPDSGELLLGGKSVVGLAPNRRDVNTVFQDYALFPHMSVLDNVAYGLKHRGVKRAQRRAQAREALELVALAERADARPGELSGGQRQRVALARALVLRPRVLLLDEPLGALDHRLRKQMQIELKRLQREVGITFVFVTHDQEEAMTMADRIAVMNIGRVEQLGTPAEIYDDPATPFAARFIGELSELEGTLAGDVLELPGGGVIPIGRRMGTFANGDRVRAGVRPESVEAAFDGEGTPATVATAMIVGDRLQMVVRLQDGQEVLLRQPRRTDDAALAAASADQQIRLRWDACAAFVLEAASEKTNEEAVR